MGYQIALEAAGAEVVEYKEFGSYQGTWIAFLKDGTFIEGSYGSCSGCDAFQAEFDYYSSPYYDERANKYFSGKSYGEEITYEEFILESQSYEDRLKRFGQQYLSDKQSIDMMRSRYEIKTTSEDYYFTEEEKEIYEWVMSKFPSDSNKVSEFFEI